MKIALAVVVLAIGFAGLLHTRAGRSLAMALGGCPVDGLSAAEVDSVLARSQHELDVRTPASARPAAGFPLDQWDVDQAVTWSKRHGLSCTQSRRGYVVLECADVPAELLSAPGSLSVDMLTMVFAGSGRLVGVDLMRRQLSGAQAAAVVSERTARLRTELGEPSDVVGSPVETTTRVRHLYRDYLATVSTARVPGSGYVVQEQYQSRL